MVNRLFSVLLCCTGLIHYSASALEVSATIDKNPIMLDEALTLTITAVGDVDRDAFDSSVLLQDFIVGNTAVNSQTRMVNFDTTRSTTWRTTLFPKQEGRFVIPAISIDGETTQPIAVRVIPTPDISTSEQRDYFVTVELANTSVYVQQHVNYIVRLHMANNIERGSLQAPVMENAVIQQVGEDRQYSDIVNGKRFQIIERTFAIVPEKSGEFVIQAPIFSGEVLARNSRQNFGFFNRTQNVTRRGPQLSLNVNPIPENYQGGWLPSGFVELNEEWSNDGEFVVGEPITRTLTLTVAGQNKEQLPELSQVYPPYLKHYPDQPSSESAIVKGQVVSQRQESTAIIPSEAGTLVVPGVDVNWFNTQTGQIETASIPPRSYTVSPATKTVTAPPQTVVSDAAKSSSPAVEDAGTLTGKAPVWWMALSGFLALAWLITLIAWWRAQKQNKRIIPTGQEQSAQRPPVNVQTAQLIQAIDANDAAHTQSKLLVWLNAFESSNFNTLAEALNQQKNLDIKMALNDFLRGHYGNAKDAKSQTQLKSAIKQREQQRPAKRKDEMTLAPMYKST